MSNSTTADPSGPLSASPTSTGITCRGISSGYRGKRVLDGITFSIDEPSIYVVLGPNGAGKTTLFRTLAGILPLSAGEATVGGSPLDAQSARDQMHYLSHMDGIPDGLTVRESLEFYAQVERATSADVDRVMEMLEIRELSGQFLSKLSAGQRKRVSIARIFLHERAIYLLDEPTANLDPKVAREIRTLILNLSRQKIVLYSSHNLFEAREIGRYVLVLKQGRLALFDRIENIRSARFIIGIRFLDGPTELPGFSRQGDYFLKELDGPEGVPAVLQDLEKQGLKIREAREMENPLEDLFA